MMRPCVDCGELSEHARCPEHQPAADQAYGSRQSRGYDATWTRLSARARRAQPFCGDCGATDNLTTDHTPEAWARKAAGQVVRLTDVDVVCGPCNTRRGSSRPGTRRANQGTVAPRERLGTAGEAKFASQSGFGGDAA